MTKTKVSVAYGIKGYKFEDGSYILNVGPRVWSLFQFTGKEYDGMSRAYDLPQGYEHVADDRTLSALVEIL